MQTWRKILTSRGAIKGFTQGKKEIFESLEMSILATLQTTIDIQKITSKIEGSFIKGKKRVAGLKILAQLLTFDNLPKAHIMDIVSWFASSMRQNQSQVTHYLDGLKGCGRQLEE